MDKKGLLQKYEKLDAHGKALLLEKIIFCKFAEDNDFKNFFKGDIKERDLFLLIDFLNKEECYIMLSDFFRKFENRLNYHNIEELEEIELDEKFFERFKQFE